MSNQNAGPPHSSELAKQVCLKVHHWQIYNLKDVPPNEVKRCQFLKMFSFFIQIFFLLSATRVAQFTRPLAVPLPNIADRVNNFPER